jgi:hypothetical protein
MDHSYKRDQKRWTVGKVHAEHDQRFTKSRSICNHGTIMLWSRSRFKIERSALVDQDIF